MAEDIFNTPTEEVSRLVAEVRETKELLRELSGKLSRIETRLKRAFPIAFVRNANGTAREKKDSRQGVPTLTGDAAIALYRSLVDLAKMDQIEEVRNRLTALSLPDLSLMRRELGASLGKRKASPKALTEAILGRIRESVMLSKHTNRQELLDQDTAPSGEDDREKGA